jgi:hypothetical protein
LTNCLPREFIVIALERRADVIKPGFQRFTADLTDMPKVDLQGFQHR